MYKYKKLILNKKKSNKIETIAANLLKIRGIKIESFSYTKSNI